jgi:hypothetical protein
VGKYKVNRETACKPKEYGGLGILNLTKFASALQMRWLCHEWNDEAKPWAGLGNHCTHQDKELFAAATRVTTGNGRKLFFWEALDLMEDGLKILPLPFLKTRKGRNAP